MKTAGKVNLEKDARIKRNKARNVEREKNRPPKEMKVPRGTARRLRRGGWNETN